VTSEAEEEASLAHELQQGFFWVSDSNKAPVSWFCFHKDTEHVINPKSNQLLRLTHLVLLNVSQYIVNDKTLKFCNTSSINIFHPNFFRSTYGLGK